MKHIFIPMMLLFLATSICSAQNTFNYKNIPVELLSKSNSVIVEEDITIDVSSPTQLLYQNRKVVTVLNENGKQNATAFINYDKDKKIDEVNVKVYDKNGVEIEKYKKRDFKDVSSSDGFSLYTDDRILYLDYTPVGYPYTLEFTYSYTQKSNAFIEPWIPLKYYVTSTLNSTYTLKFDPNNKPKIYTQNLDGYAIEITEGPSSYVAKATSIKAVKYESLKPSTKKWLPLVKFMLPNFYFKGVYGSANSWKEFGGWYQKSLLANVSNLPDATKQQVKNLVATASTNEEKARLIYQYVQDKVRYVSVQIGIGGWKPMLASDVDRLSYGDCKALTNYTKALLDVVGVPSYYTVIFAGEQQTDLRENFPSIEGNHVILGIPNLKNTSDITWLECTNQKVPFGFLGDFTDNRKVLIITPEGGEIIKTKKYSAQDNTVSLKATLTMDHKFGLKGSVVQKAKGVQYGNHYYLEDEKQDDIDEHYKYYWGHLDNLETSEISFNNNKEDIVFTETLDISTTGYISLAGDRILLTPNVFNRYKELPDHYSERLSEFEIQRGYTFKDEVTITLPNALAIGSLFKPILIESEYGTYHATIEELSPNTLLYKRTFEIKEGLYPKEAYASYEKFIKKVVKKERSKIILTQK